MKTDRLLCLEAGRFFAATLVMLYHFSDLIGTFKGVFPLGWAFRAGHCGVEFFFVLSGFLIVSQHRGQSGAAAAVQFARRRALRVYPPFLVISSGLLVLWLVLPVSRAAPAGLLDPVRLVADLMLAPTSTPVLGVSWSLRHEAMFYAVFGLALLIGRRGWWLVAAWQALVAGCVFLIGQTGGEGLAPLLGVSNLGFGFGMLVALGQPARILPRVTPTLWLASGGGLLSVLTILEWFVGRQTPVAENLPFGPVGSPLLYSIAAMLVVQGLVAWERSGGRLAAPRLVTLLGGASYLLYLTHGLVGSAVIRVLPSGVSPEAALLVLAATAISSAGVAYAFIEKPWLAWVMRRDAVRTGLPTDGRPMQKPFVI